MQPCPRCTYPLEIVEHRGVELDHCRRCGGSFLPSPEAGRVIFGRFVDPSVWGPSPITQSLGTAEYRCPRDGQALHAMQVSFDQRAVEVDLCPVCGGLWFDSGEGKQLRDIVMAAGQSDESELSTMKRRSGPAGYIFQMLSRFPLEVWNPVHHTPRTTLSLIGIIVAVFAFQLLAQGETLVESFAMVPADILAGRNLWTLLTNLFLHGGLFHLGANVYFLWVFGDNVEDYLSGPVFLALFIISGFAASLAQALTQVDAFIPVLGASGAISGVMGAYLVLFPRVKIYQTLIVLRFRVNVAVYIVLWIAGNLLGLILAVPGVAYQAHIGGLIAGLIIAWPLRLRPLARMLRHRVQLPLR